MMHNNSNNSRRPRTASLSDDEFCPATQIDPPIPPESGTCSDSSVLESSEEVISFRRRRLSCEVKELSRNLDALLLDFDKKQDFEKYGGIFYSKKALVCMMADHMKPPPFDPKKWTQQGHDAARLFALKAYYGTFPRTIDTISPNSVYPGVHCQSSLNDLRRLIGNMDKAFGDVYEPVDEVLFDYNRIPDHWLLENLSPNFFSEVIFHWLANDYILKSRGRIILPNTPYVYEQIKLNYHLLSPLCEDIRFLHDPTLNPLYNATEAVDELLRASRTSNETALHVLLEYKHMPKGAKPAPFIALLKRGLEDGIIVTDLTSNFYDQERASSFRRVAFEPVEKKGTKRFVEYTPPTPIKRNKTRTTSSSSSSSSNSSPIIDLTSEEEDRQLLSSSSRIKGRVSFTP